MFEYLQVLARLNVGARIKAAFLNSANCRDKNQPSFMQDVLRFLESLGLLENSQCPPDMGNVEKTSHICFLPYKCILLLFLCSSARLLNDQSRPLVEVLLF